MMLSAGSTLGYSIKSSGLIAINYTKHILDFGCGLNCGGVGIQVILDNIVKAFVHLGGLYGQFGSQLREASV